MICHSGPKRVPEIIPDDRVRKGQTKLNVFSVLDEQIKSLSSKQSKLNFWNRLNPKFAFLCRLLTQTATWRPNHQILTLSVTAILKAMTDTVFLGPTLGVVRIFHLRLEVFWTKESTLRLTAWTFSYSKLPQIKEKNYASGAQIARHLFQVWYRD